MSKYKTIGILGGMGPEATAELYLRIIRLFQNRLGAQLDKDFPNILINSVPVPDIVLTRSNEMQVRELLVRAAKNLESVGSDFIVIPCNTAEIFIEGIRDAVKIPIISIVEEVDKLVKKKRIKVVGLLATETTLKYKTYEKGLAKSGANIKKLKKADRKELTNIILNVLAGKKLEEDKKQLEILIKSLGTECVVLGCTDLPLLLDKKERGIELIDTITVLAEAAFDSSANFGKENVSDL